MLGLGLGDVGCRGRHNQTAGFEAGFSISLAEQWKGWMNGFRGGFLQQVHGAAEELGVRKAIVFVGRRGHRNVRGEGHPIGFQCGQKATGTGGFDESLRSKWNLKRERDRGQE